MPVQQQFHIHHTRTYAKRFLWLCLFGFVLALLFVSLAFFLIHLESSSYIATTSDEVPARYTAIVLGAGILRNGELSPVLRDRVDTAIVLYNTGKVKTILVTGDDGSVTHNEVNPSRDYLLANGIPTEAIFLDHAGFDTYSSMYRARVIFLVDSAIIVTQSFHLPRSVFIARRLGINAYGLSADRHIYGVRNNLRELLANVKAVSNVLYHRQPKYLGDKIPITGDSSVSI